MREAENLLEHVPVSLQHNARWIVAGCPSHLVQVKQEEAEARKRPTPTRDPCQTSSWGGGARFGCSPRNDFGSLEPWSFPPSR